MRPDDKVKGGVLALERFVPYRLSVLSNLVSGAIAERYSARFRLTIPEWRVMAVLGRFPGLPAREIAQRTAMDKVQVSRAVARLAESGRLDVRRDGEDGRITRLALTPKGLAVYAEIVPLARHLEEKLMRALNEDERAAFEAALSKLTAAAASL